MMRRDSTSFSSTHLHHFLTISSLVISLVCFGLFFITIEKMTAEIENVLNISITKSDYLTRMNDLIFLDNDVNDKNYQKKIADLHNDYVKAIQNSTITNEVKNEETHFAENIYIKARTPSARGIYKDISIDNNRFPEMASSLLKKSKNSYKNQLFILIFIPTLMALLRCIQAIYYFYSLRRLRGNYMLDPLTGVYNRRYLSNLRKSEELCYILAIDVDDFKTVNDTWGHSFGDLVLQECIKSMKLHLREHDIVVRMGGDEFSIFLFKTDNEGAKVAARRLLETIQELQLPLPEGGFFTPSVSIGMAQCDGPIERAMQEADHNLYMSKREGKNTLTFEESSHHVE